MSTQDPIYVIGHRNPDTDAICSAIGYAAFLRDVRGMDAVAACCGELSVRTNWVLHTANVTAPRLLLDVRPTAATICRRDVLTARPADTFLSVYRMMLEHGFRSIPVVDAEGRLLGVPSIQEMAELFLPVEGSSLAGNRAVRTSLANIVAALGGRLAGEASEAEREQDFVLVVAASSVETSRQRAMQFQPRDVALVTGDRPEIHALAIELGARCLVITGGFQPWRAF
ncbi:MAG: DHH family phosphoesterase [Verrucomicrobiaceae bacterium]|nr:DHH family phosphoesterase [Verrucomicrobiaceae bacterium]